jgi:hypothetical protein
MSPLAGLLLRVMRTGSLAAAAFLALVLVIEVWKRWQGGSFGALTRPDISFLVIVVLMIVGFLWLARAIGREIRKHGS